MLDIICNNKFKCYVAGIHEIISFTIRIKNNYKMKMITKDLVSYGSVKMKKQYQIFNEHFTSQST